MTWGGNYEQYPSYGGGGAEISSYQYPTETRMHRHCRRGPPALI